MSLCEMNPKLNCVHCGQEFNVVVEDELICAEGVDGVVICETTPCYGSKVYDMVMGDPRLEFIICDACFKELRPGMYEKKGRLERLGQETTTSNNVSTTNVTLDEEKPA